VTARRLVDREAPSVVYALLGALVIAVALAGAGLSFFAARRRP